jgi:hypothetical protein
MLQAETIQLQQEEELQMSTNRRHLSTFQQQIRYLNSADTETQLLRISNTIPLVKKPNVTCHKKQSAEILTTAE